MDAIEQALTDLMGKFQPEAAEGLDLKFQFELSDGKPFQLLIADQQCTVEYAEDDDADITLSCDSETLQGILSGERDGMQAFLAGDLQAEGDIALALKLPELFALGSD